MKLETVMCRINKKIVITGNRKGLSVGIRLINDEENMCITPIAIIQIAEYTKNRFAKRLRLTVISCILVKTLYKAVLSDVRSFIK